MTCKWIKNCDEVAHTDLRQKAIEILESGYDAIDTEKAIERSIKVENNAIIIKDKTYELSKYKRVRVIGFGKASCTAAAAIDRILGNIIQDGVVIDVRITHCDFIRTYTGSHPKPTADNVLATKEIVNMAKDCKEDDLVIVIVSGGGSALLCWPESEWLQEQKLYEDFLKTGGNIHELNTVRKHLSSFKGGGLAKMLYPATIAGLIFCDVPGGHYRDVASGPTYKDDSTIEEAEYILKKYEISDGYQFKETPKEDMYFEKVKNFHIVSNERALEAMKKKAEEFGLDARILSSDIYDFADIAVQKMFRDVQEGQAIIAGGEVRLLVRSLEGSGGRCQYMAMEALKHVKEKDVFASVASDGRDNSNAAGALVDIFTNDRVKEVGIDYEQYLKAVDAYRFFEKVGGLVFTEPTGMNVSDLFLLVRGK